MKKLKLFGPFRQVLTMDKLPVKGPLSDNNLEIIEHAGILVDGEIIESVGPFRDLSILAGAVEPVGGEFTVIPGFVDCHTHICWAGSRANDYALRLSGKNYQEIAREFGGIWSTVIKTREAEEEELARNVIMRSTLMLQAGTTTIEVKSGYGLNTGSELKILSAIRKAGEIAGADLVATCLAAHIKPKDFKGTEREYLDHISRELLPAVRSGQLSRRVDIYIDEGAFSVEDARIYLDAAKKTGFNVVVHADQFSRGGAQLAVEAGAISADHLEISTEEDIRLLAHSGVIPVVLPGSSMGLGSSFAAARKLLNAGASLAIASDWNPGSAPMGNLLMQAAVLGMAEKLTMTETLAALTFRASKALALNDRGILRPGMLADFIAFPCNDYKEILYNQGSMGPVMVWKKGVKKTG
jgi:imidazolonepropionase